MSEAVVWTREKLEERKAQLQQGLESLTNQFQQAYSQQQGAIALVDQMLAEMDAPPADKVAEEKKNRAQLRREQRAAKKAAEAARKAQPEPTATEK